MLNAVLHRHPWVVEGNDSPSMRVVYYLPFNSGNGSGKTRARPLWQRVAYMDSGLLGASFRPGKGAQGSTHRLPSPEWRTGWTSPDPGS